MGRAPGSCGAQARREEEVDARASSTTSNEAWARNPLAPFGLRRRAVVCFVSAPGLCDGICLRRGASHTTARRSQRGPSEFAGGLLVSAIFIVLPLALIFVIVALIVFVKAVRSGQFDDLDTPAVRMLHDEEASSAGQAEATPRDPAERPDPGRDGQ